jgi:transposase
MMGRKALAGKLFYQVSLEELVPDGHLLRRVAAAVDFGVARRLTARFYSHTGQPSVDPVVLFKLALLGHLYGLPSKRRLVDDIRVNLAYRGFIGYDLDGAIPDHSVLSKARRRFGPTVYEAFFTDVVRPCERAGLIRGDRLFLDSTLVAAHADLGRVGSRELIRQLSPVSEHVADLWDANPDGTDEAAELAPPASTPEPARPADGGESGAIEAVFGDGKERRVLGGARCRGLDAVRIQALLAATAQNIRKLALHRPAGPASASVSASTASSHGPTGSYGATTRRLPCPTPARRPARRRAPSSRRFSPRRSLRQQSLHEGRSSGRGAVMPAMPWQAAVGDAGQVAERHSRRILPLRVRFRPVRASQRGEGMAEGHVGRARRERSRDVCW